jgi:glycosyltransferase involved in cell wall biosynthesis
LSDTTYRSCTPDYEHCLSFYGSEPAHAIIAKGLVQKGHDVHFFAPQGSEPIGTFHPLICFNGAYSENEILDETSLEGLKTEYLKDFDFILDFSAVARNIEYVRNYYGFLNYGVFRNGYNGYTVPRLRLKDRHYIVPSVQNKRIFEKHGFPDVFVAYYGIPDDFYCPFTGSVYEVVTNEFFQLNGLEWKEYFLYPHRPTPDKGSLHILELAQHFPEETFVFMVSNNPVQQHKSALQDLKKLVITKGLQNVKFVELPLTNKHHYFKRELMRHAKAVLSPFNPSVYLEGFGLANAEAVACGTPLLITDSESSRELWIDEKDGLIIPYDDRLWGFKQAIKHFDSYSFKPVNKFSVTDCINNYEKFIKDTIERNNNNEYSIQIKTGPYGSTQ